MDDKEKEKDNEKVLKKEEKIEEKEKENKNEQKEEEGEKTKKEEKAEADLDNNSKKEGNNEKRGNKNHDSNSNRGKKPRDNDPNQALDEISGNSVASVLDILAGLKSWVGIERRIEAIVSPLSVFTTMNFKLNIKECDKIPHDFSYYRVAEYGQIYAIVKDYNIEFETLDDLFNRIVPYIMERVDNALVYMREPHSVTYENINTKDPDALGVSVNELADKEDFAEFRARIANCCRANVGDKIIRVNAQGEEIEKMIRHLLYDYILEASEAIEQETDIERFIRFVSLRDMNRLRKYPSNDSTHITYISDFHFDTMNILDDLMFETYIRIRMIAEVVAPKIYMGRKNMAQVSRFLGISATRAADSIALLQVRYETSMEGEISNLISSYLMWGYIKFRILFNPDEESEEFTIKNMIIGFICKLIFNYTERGTECNLIEESAKYIDGVIAKGLRSYGYRFYCNDLEWALNINADIEGLEGRHLDNLERQRRETIRRFGMDINNINTNRLGVGWMSDGRQQRLDNDWGAAYYLNSELRPIFGPQIYDMTEEEFTENQMVIRDRWRVATSIINIMDSAKRTKQYDKANKNFLDLIIDNMLSFYFRMNEYMRLNYYCGYRFTTTQLGKILSRGDRVNDIPVVDIQANTILYFAQSIECKSPFERQVSVIDQLKTEINFKYNYESFIASYRIISGWIQKYHVENEIMRPRRIKMARKAMKDGVFKTLLNQYEDCGLINRIPTNTTVAMLESFYNRLLCEVNTELINEPLRMSVIDRIQVGMSRGMPDLGFIRQLAIDKDLYTNWITRESYKTLTGYDIVNLYKERRYYGFLKHEITMNDRFFDIRLPFKYRLIHDSKFRTQGNPIKIIWSIDLGRDIRQRTDIKLGTVNEMLTYVVLKNKMFLDDYVGDFETNEDVYVERNDMKIWDINEFELEHTFGRVLCLKEGVNIYEFFDLFS